MLTKSFPFLCLPAFESLVTSSHSFKLVLVLPMLKGFYDFVDIIRF